MAFKCDNCSKSVMWGHRVSHAKNRTNHGFKPNIQKKRIEVEGKMIRVKLCTNCIKLMKKTKKKKVSEESLLPENTHSQSL
ncbi:MAG: 50S ribosomal protein L28 [Candidatus Levybacteria bacterium CG10_big_fil_rev_8_21_14_0_10_36_7]|nr:MAG: 50S ribosomal protein L28 [Candidatus Levybacteria bacterium CG10_big_fil_rev_8_21_14_0_10_36_7]